jgi:hypothetical protein
MVEAEVVDAVLTPGVGARRDEVYDRAPGGAALEE